MIRPGEIQLKAQLAGVRDQQIEKDYVLSWILQGIAHHPELLGSLAFKGGTVLKKVYFDDYRFSEDLDFTLVNASSAENLLTWFQEVFAYVLEEANIPLEIIDQNNHREDGMNFYVSYVGPLGGLGTNKKVKVDISLNEELLFKPEMKDAILNYSDQSNHQLFCYTLEEVLIEKLRSIIQRMQARDFYDTWYLLEIQGLKIEFCQSEFEAKCAGKGINSAEFHSKLEKRIPQYQARWKTSMSDQIHDLPEFDTVLRETMRHLKKLT